jgi:hypothetical protein
MSSNLTILIYLIKKFKHKVMWACASFKLKELSLEDVLENNINHILGPHLTA